MAGVTVPECMKFRVGIKAPSGSQWSSAGSLYPFGISCSRRETAISMAEPQTNTLKRNFYIEEASWSLEDGNREIALLDRTGLTWRQCTRGDRESHNATHPSLFAQVQSDEDDLEIPSHHRIRLPSPDQLRGSPAHNHG